MKNKKIIVLLVTLITLIAPLSVGAYEADDVIFVAEDSSRYFRDIEKNYEVC